MNQLWKCVQLVSGGYPFNNSRLVVFGLFGVINIGVFISARGEKPASLLVLQHVGALACIGTWNDGEVLIVVFFGTRYQAGIW